MKTEVIESLLREALPCHVVEVNTRDHVHYEAIVVSDTFVGMPRLKRQQSVYAVLGQYLQSGEIHALALKTWAVDEWKKEQQA